MLRQHKGMSMRFVMAVLLLLAAPAFAAPPPIIDMHLHAYPADAQGPPPVAVCAPYDQMPVRDPRWDAQTYAAKTFKQAICAHPVWSSKDDATLMKDSLAMLEKYNITAVTSGPAPLVEAWRKASPRIIPGLEFGLHDQPRRDTIKSLHGQGKLAVLGEIGTQYEGVAPNDARLEPYY